VLTNINNIMNKYNRWYNQIVEQAQNRVVEGYTERHHIQPRSLGGADTPDNLVNLTAREHFICHWLLTKMTTGEDRYKMLNALRMMRAEKHGQQRYETAITGRVYESIKQEYAALQSILRSGKGNGFYGKTHTESAKQRISDANKGRIQPPDEKAKQIASITGRTRAPFSEEWRANMSKKKQGENNPRYGVTVSSETKQKMREKALGRKQSKETIAKKVAATKGKTREKILCPHCGEMIAVNTYSRWHGPSCRHRPC
jgi:hypothetical protein